jgi:hypothetical protein
MDASYTIHKDESNCRFIVENTIRECNRVLKSWETQNQQIHNDNISCLGNHYLTRFIRAKFGYKNGFKISDYSPLYFMRGNRIVRITLSDLTGYYRYRREVDVLKKYLETFDFDAFYKTLELEDALEEPQKKQIDLLSDINFDDIKRIKF